MTKTTDTFAAVEDTLNSAFASVKANQEKFAKAAEVEAAKIQKATMEGLDSAVSAHHANIDNLVAATKSAVEGFTKIGEVAKTQIETAFEDRSEDIKAVMKAKDPQEALAIQVELTKAAQARATKAAEAISKASQEAAQSVMKSFEAQLNANMKMMGLFTKN